MDVSAFGGRPARVPSVEPERQESLNLSQLPPELLMMVLSHLPPHTLLECCRLVSRRWRALVDSQALWLLILARDHCALLGLIRSSLPAARDARPCLLGRFCVRKPLGRNLIRNSCGQEGHSKWVMENGGSSMVAVENLTFLTLAPRSTCFVSSFSWRRKKQVVDLEEEGVWPELLDSGKIEICIFHRWGIRHSSNCTHRITVQLLNANQTVLDEFSERPYSIQQGNASLQVTHVFSNIKTGVRFVSFEHWYQSWSGPYGAHVTTSSVTMRVHLS